MRGKSPYSEFFWSVFSRIQTEYGEILRIFPYSVWIRENTDQKNFDYGHFLRSEDNNINYSNKKNINSNLRFWERKH